MAAYGTPSSSRVLPAPDRAGGSGASWAGGGIGTAGVGTGLLPSGGRERGAPGLRWNGGAVLRAGGGRHEMHVVLLRGRPHSREGRGERRLGPRGGGGLGGPVVGEPPEGAGGGGPTPGGPAE